MLIVGGLTLLFEKGQLESRLLEVAVRPEGVGNPLLLHDNKGDTVREGPFLVVAPGE
ncbi:MAG TPA: hypothetical protein PKI11_14325 [Candidatus Hydrogenedentes bacterium]|nr:hypothetical protein [Candidatus Hydrogenedentota bacterium]